MQEGAHAGHMLCVETLHDMPQGARRVTPRPQDSQAMEKVRVIRKGVLCILLLQGTASSSLLTRTGMAPTPFVSRQARVDSAWIQGRMHQATWSWEAWPR